MLDERRKKRNKANFSQPACNQWVATAQTALSARPHPPGFAAFLFRGARSLACRVAIPGDIARVRHFIAP